MCIRDRSHSYLWLHVMLLHRLIHILNIGYTTVVFLVLLFIGLGPIYWLQRYGALAFIVRRPRETGFLRFKRVLQRVRVREWVCIST